MFLLLNKHREMVSEIMEYLSITATIRFSSPGQLTMVLSEESDEAKRVKELMHVFHVETNMLYLVDYVERSTVYNDAKAVTVKCITIEGFLEQRIIATDKILDGASLQTAVHELFNENVTAPADTTRKLDFFTFVDSDDSLVLGAKVKGLVSGISVMQAITSLLEAKNMGYKVTYNIVTKQVSFIIVAGRNLCDGFTSVLHGASRPNTVTLSTQSETLKDVTSIVDMAPYKTRVYVKNFDELKTFNRGETESGIDLREGYLSTGHGDGYGEGWAGPELPPPPNIVFPELGFPGEIPVPIPEPETNLIGLYVLTNYNRLLGCAFYPDLPIPEVWFDITPDFDGESNDSLSSQHAKVTLVDGDLIIGSSDRRRLYRASMAGGWFGTRYFQKAELILDVSTFDIVPGIGRRWDTVISIFGVDVRTGRIAGSLASTALNNPWFNGHSSVVFDGTAYDIKVVSSPSWLDIAFPGFFDLWPVSMEINNDTITISGQAGTMSSTIAVFNGAWQPLDQWNFRWGDKQWHARPEPGNDVTYFTKANEGWTQLLYRTKDMFGGGPIEFVNGLNIGWMPGTKFSPDGKAMISWDGFRGFVVTTLPYGNLSDIVTVRTPFTCLSMVWPTGLSSAGTDKATGKNRWGYMTNGNSPDLDIPYVRATPAYYVTNESNFSDVTNITPLLKTYLQFGPYGVNGSGLLNEVPVYVWPILG